MSNLLSEENRAFATGMAKGMTCRPWWITGRQYERPDLEHVQSKPGVYDAGHVVGSVLQGLAVAVTAAAGTNGLAGVLP